MLRIVNLEEMQREIMKISALVDLQQRRDFSLEEKVKGWLANLEKTLESNHFMQAGEIAALRGMILSAENGIVPPAVAFHGLATRQKIVAAAISFALRQAGSVVSEVLKEDVSRVAGAERMMRQLVAIAKAKNLLQPVSANNNHTESLKFIWRTLAKDADIAAGTINVEGLVGPHDALILLDRIIASDGEQN
jgi:hypothetical protein